MQEAGSGAEGSVTGKQQSTKILDRLTKLHPKLIDLSLGRIETLLGRLGNPERALPPVVHVAGTNGKGSVIAYMRAALEAAGHGVHVHVTPHLVRFNERIRLGGQLIPEDDLIALLRECEDANGGEPITFFEITTAAALLAFARTPADVLLLETGLGGRLDATNVVKRPALTVITPVSIDHQQFLGNTLAEIAGEKAGILKPGVVCVLARQEPDAAEIIRARAAGMGVALYEQDRDWTVAADGDDMVYEGPRGSKRLPRPNLVGVHQIGNAGVAVAALDRLRDFPLDEKTLARGVTEAHWPARLQHLTEGGLAGLLRPEQELWLDGGHNEAAAAAIAAWLDTEDGKPLHLILGMLKTKQAGAFLAELKPHIASLRTVAIPGEDASQCAEDLARSAKDVGLDAMPAAGVAMALGEITRDEAGPGRILIAGSLYLAGWVLGENG
jgi:dihydrofolate synthase/folylpolyglutamate synthase